MKPRKILLVEDDALIADLLELILEDAGHEVFLARDGDAATTMVGGGDSIYDILITDIRLPGPDGWAVSRHVRAALPEIAVIYISGDGAHEWPENGVPRSLILQKPFAKAPILEAIEKSLT
jgi:DNA-binding response OmpR family regulator